ncbi:MAG: riboflavin biosynthesis protein RibF [Clostridiales bacterium]|nr:riboflavin biosynthesis protein RibF [Clostridiales bacterium]
MRLMTYSDGMSRLGRVVVAIGVFDGVHIGHQALLHAATSDATRRGCPAVAVTFDRHPGQVISPESAPPQLLTVEDKCALIAEAGADIVLVIPFDLRIAHMPPARFIDGIVLSALDPVAIHVGSDFHFGHRAQGDVRTLSSIGALRGFAVSGHELVETGDLPVTSTRIRALVAEGDVSAAAALLGRAHRVSGRVVHGRGQGASLLGIPTANIAPREFSALPANGVYAGYVSVDSRSFPAGISVGTPPTFPEARDTLEAHLLGFDGELRGSDVTLNFHERLRDQRAFENPEGLASAILADLERVRILLTGGSTP